MSVVAVLSLKGGVGKSTTTLGIAGAAWARGDRVLVIDLDPQANATSALDVAPHPFTMNDVLADGRPGIAAEALVSSGWGPGIDVLTSEEALAHRNKPEGPDSATRLRITLQGVTEAYALVIIDCPPSLDELTRNALAAADRALIVTEPGYFALQGTDRALRAVDVARDSFNLRLRPAGILVNRVREALGEHRRHLQTLRDDYPGLLVGMEVPESPEISEAQRAGVPIQAWPSPGARIVANAFDDVLDVLIT
ncbi:MAG: ParA family protein [Actinomycetota bacterium]